MGGGKASLNDLLRLVAERGASDLHLKVFSPPFICIHGKLAPLDEFAPLTPSWIEEVTNLLTDEKGRQSFYQQRELDFSYEAEGVGRFRVNASFQKGSINLSFRYIPQKIPSIEELNLPEICRSLILKHRGLILVTGPSGSGKSTTLAAMIQYLNEHQAKRIVTIEDPIEFLFKDKKSFITQREIGSDTLSFASALKHALRQNPHVIMVGEMRDLETISAALTAAETGHLILSTLHTPGAAEAIDRIIDIFPPHQQRQVRIELSLSLLAVLYQVLVPRADRDGRIPAVEILVATPAIRSLIREERTHLIANAMQTGRQYGMQTLEQALADLVKKGLVRFEDALTYSNHPEVLKQLI